MSITPLPATQVGGLARLPFLLHLLVGRPSKVKPGRQLNLSVPLLKPLTMPFGKEILLHLLPTKHCHFA